MLNKIVPIFIMILILMGLTGCSGGGGSDNPTAPYLPPSGEPPEEPEDPLFPYLPDEEEEPLPDRVGGIYYETSTAQYGRAIIPGFERADKRSQAYLPMRVAVVESDGDPLKHKIVRRILVGDEYILIVWDPTGFYNPRFIHSEAISRTLAADIDERSAMLSEYLGVENPATTNIGIGAESIDISIGLDRISELESSSISTYASFFTDENLLGIFASLLESNVFGGNIVKFHGTYGQYQLGQTISTMVDDGALIMIGGYVDLADHLLSTFQMGTPDDAFSEESNLINSFVYPRIPTESENCMTVFSSFLQVTEGTDPGAVSSAFENVFFNHPFRHLLGGEQRYMVINFRPVVDVDPEIITAPIVRTQNLIVILPIDPLALNLEPGDGSFLFSSGVTKIFQVTAHYSLGATYTLTPNPTESNWFRNRIITNVEPILPGDVIANPGQGLLPSATFLSELDRFVSVTHITRDYSNDAKLHLKSNVISITPQGGSVSNLPPDLSSVRAVPSEGRAPLTVTFDATGAVDADGEIISYEWNFGNPDIQGGGTDVGAAVNHMYGTPGVRTALLTVKDDGVPQNTIMKQLTINITANQPPIAVISEILVTEGMAPFTVQFDGTASHDPDGQIAEFRWDFGEGVPSPLAAPEHTFYIDGDYLVTLRVTDNGPSPPKYNEDSVWIHVLPESTNTAPVAKFIADPQAGQAPLTVQFDSSQSYDPDGHNLTYEWFFGDMGIIGGGMSQDPNPVHTYDQPQNAIVTLKVTDDDTLYPLDNTFQLEIEVLDIVNENPVPLFTIIPDSGMATLTVDFDASDSYDPDGNITGYSWDFGDGGNAFGHIVQHDFTADGIYEISLIVGDDAAPPGTGMAMGEVVVGNTKPIAVIEADIFEGEAPLVVNFDATGSYDDDGDNLTYYWDFGDEEFSSDAVVQHTFQIPMDYTVTLVVLDDHGTPKNLEGVDTALISVTEPPPNAPPVVIIGTDNHFGSVPLTVQFDCVASYDPDGDNIVGYHWDFGDLSGESDEIAPEYTFNNMGTYFVTLQLTDDGLPAESGYGVQGIYVDVNVPPIPVMEADILEGEQPLTVQFTGENSYDPDGIIILYLWDFGMGSSSEEPNPEVTFYSDGEFMVVLSLIDDAAPPGMAMDFLTVNVSKCATNDQPNAEIIAIPTYGSAPLTVDFSAESSADRDGEVIEVLWNFGDPDVPGGGESTDFVTQHTYNSPGSHKVTLLVCDDGTPQLCDLEIVFIDIM